MIVFLRTWCEGIIVCVFISLIIEMLVPNGSIKKYVNVIIGIYIIFVILNPVISNIDSIDMKKVFDFEKDYSTQTFESTTSQMVNVYEKTMEEELKEKCIGIDKVKIVFSNDLEDIEKIEIVANENADIESIKKYIKDNYKVSENIISIIS